MGTQVISIMRYLILLALSGLLHAAVVVNELLIHEGGTNYTQTITRDFDRNIQILEVPAHDHNVHSKTIFDFNQGVMIESYPQAKLCYIQDIPVEIASMDKFEIFWDDNKGTIEAAKEHTNKRTYKIVSHQQLSALATEVVKECTGSTTYFAEPLAVEENEISYQRSSTSLGKIFGDECAFPARCLWQTCRLSCLLRVNCDDIIDAGCSGALESNNNIDIMIDECDNVACQPCFNRQCPGCNEVWDECEPDFIQGHVSACPDDLAIGNGCDGSSQVFCPMVEDIPGGVWRCQGGDSTDPKQPAGQICLLFCTGDYGGSITCEDDGNWSFTDKHNNEVEAGDLTCI